MVTLAERLVMTTAETTPHTYTCVRNKMSFNTLVTIDHTIFMTRSYSRHMIHSGEVGGYRICLQSNFQGDIVTLL